MDGICNLNNSFIAGHRANYFPVIHKTKLKKNKHLLFMVIKAKCLHIKNVHRDIGMSAALVVSVIILIDQSIEPDSIDQQQNRDIK